MDGSTKIRIHAYYEYAIVMLSLLAFGNILPRSILSFIAGGRLDNTIGSNSLVSVDFSVNYFR